MIIEKIKTWWGVAVTVVLGVVWAMLGIQRRKTEEAQAALAKASFKLTTQENDRDYEDAKTNADRLVSEYQSGKRTDDAT